MEMLKNPAKYEVLIKQYLRASLDMSADFIPGQVHGLEFCNCWPTPSYYFLLIKLLAISSSQFQFRFQSRIFSSKQESDFTTVQC